MLVLSSVLFASCSSAVAAQVPPTLAASLTPTSLPPTEMPAASPTPQATKVLLVAPAGADIQAVQSTVAELSAKSGLTVDVRPSLQKPDLTPEVDLVVSLVAPANLAERLSAAPQVQFVEVSSSDIPTTANLTVIRFNGENQAFLAGFISVLLSKDYRAAGLLPTDGPNGVGLKEAFVNGGHFFCGVCSPGWPINVTYPVTADQPSAADGPTWQTAAASLFDNQKVEVYFLTPESIQPEVISYLQGKTQLDMPIALVGETAPPDARKSQWAASIQFDIPAALRQVWPDVISGKGGTVEDALLLVDIVNQDLLGEGRMRLVKNLMDQLKNGQVSPMSVPAQ